MLSLNEQESGLFQCLSYGIHQSTLYVFFFKFCESTILILYFVVAIYYIFNLLRYDTIGKFVVTCWSPKSLATYPKLLLSFCFVLIWFFFSISWFFPAGQKCSFFLNASRSLIERAGKKVLHVLFIIDQQILKLEKEKEKEKINIYDYHDCNTTVIISNSCTHLSMCQHQRFKVRMWHVSSVDCQVWYHGKGLICHIHYQ